MASISTLPIDHPPQLTPAVHTALGRLRGRIRRYVWQEGLVAAAVWLGAAFWTSLALDWLFEPPLAFRAGVLAIAAAGLLVVLVRFIGRRAFVRLTDANMATLLERRFPQLNDSLLTSVVLTGREPKSAGYDPKMLAFTLTEAQHRLTGVRLPEVFNFMPLYWKAIVSAGLVLAVGVLAAMTPGTLDIWSQRNLALKDMSWPQKIQLVPVGFKDGVAKVASGADFELLVQAFRGDTELPVVPDQLEVRYKFDGGGRFRHTMDSIGTTAPVGQAFSLSQDDRLKACPTAQDEILQQYGFKFRGVLTPVRLDIAGGGVQFLGFHVGETRLRNLKIEVVPNPTLTRVELRYEYPAYMERPPRTVPVAGAMPVPVGTKITVHARANKPLQLVRIDCLSGGKPSGPERRIEGDALGAGRDEFFYALDPFPFSSDVAANGPRDAVVLFSLKDADGIKSREPLPLSLVAVPDEPPQVAVRLTGIETAITPQARLPFTGRITDDYGLARAWYEYAISDLAGKKRSGTATLADLPKHPAEFPLADVAMEVRDLKLVRGQSLEITVKAADLMNLGRGPNVGTSETWRLEDVVSPDELRSMLEAREIVLRQRFEAIIQEVAETRDLLLRMDFNADGTGETAPAAKAAGAEPGDQEKPREKLSPGELAARRTERILQTLQNCRKNAQETLGVAESIDDIRQQLANNRIETEELKNRLGAGIAEPLHRIGEEMFPVLEKRLEGLQAAVADLKTGPDRRDAARKQADDILLEMKKVLSRMIELGNFNELVERFRKVIELQEQLNKRTSEQHKQRIRDLLEK